MYCTQEKFQYSTIKRNSPICPVIITTIIISQYVSIL